MNALHLGAFCVVAAVLGACADDDDVPGASAGATQPPVVQENLGTNYTGVAVDDSIGLTCFYDNSTSDEPVGRNVEQTTRTAYGPCVPTGTVLALAAKGYHGFDVRSIALPIVIDDANGLVCLERANSPGECFSQSALNAAGVAALRASAN